MPRATFEVVQMLRAPGIRPQVLDAVEKLSKILRWNSKQARGRAYQVCDIWQRRFELALHNEIPDWVGLAAFRCMLDYYLTADDLSDLEKTRQPGTSAPSDDVPKTLNSLEECWQAYVQYLEEKRDLYSGKFLLQDPDVQNWFLNKMRAGEPVLGGQAGNIAWLWQCMGSNAVIYTPYLSPGLSKLPDKLPNLSDVQIVRLEKDKSQFIPWKDTYSIQGVPKSDKTRVPAPSAGSLAATKDEARMLYIFPGWRIFEPISDQTPDWRRVQFFYRGQALLDQALERTEQDPTWPSIPLFCECRVNAALEQLEITLAHKERLTAALKGKVDFAVLGGMDAIFYDAWLKRAPRLQARLTNILEEQLHALRECGIRIGVELSGIPAREYALFIRRMCERDIIVALGINGVDELPQVTGEKSLENQLFDFWLDPQQAPSQLWVDLHKTGETDKHKEFLTYLRAKKLAAVTGVRTLYVHTATLDFILRRDADPGALLRAQLGDIMGKGLVIAALMQRAYKDQWLGELKKMPSAVNPTAMEKLGQFALDFEKYENLDGAGDRLLSSGYWLAPSPSEYAVAVVPVIWPEVSDTRVGKGLPEKLNSTGAGDMTFGAFFLLGGV